MATILITGANGFVGKVLCTELLGHGHAVRAAVRAACSAMKHVDMTVVGSIDGETDWTAALAGIDVVIHLAARVHVMHDKATDPLNEFRHVNTAGTEHLARAAAASGVKRLVFVSSIKVNGESTFRVNASSKPPIPANLDSTGGRSRSVFSETDEANPQDPYGVSKWEAEQALHRVATETGLEVVIVRPPIVYGPGVKGNFERMLGALCRGVPLPVVSIKNFRSMLYFRNLVDALRVCAHLPAAAGQTYLLCDGEDISTPNLLRQLGLALGKPARIFPFPVMLLKLAGNILGKSNEINRLVGSLQIDSGKIRRELNWQPPYSLHQGLQATADWYRASRP